MAEIDFSSTPSRRRAPGERPPNPPRVWQARYTSTCPRCNERICGLDLYTEHTADLVTRDPGKDAMHEVVHDECAD